MPIEINPIQFQQFSNEAKPEFIAKCFNKETTLSDETKLVIVGTLTPPDTAYFYCSYLNRIYGYIDEALKALKKEEDSLKELKTGLSKYVGKRKTIYLLPKAQIEKNVIKIKRILSKNHIAFLDVMEKAIRVRVSPYDDDIRHYVLAQNDFHNIPTNATVIANSKLAYECAKRLNVNNLNYLSQRCGKKEDWIEMIKTALL